MKWIQRNSYPVVIILTVLLAAFVRLVFLDRFPTSISGDELIYPFTAKAVSLTGTDITGTWGIFQSLLFKYPPNQLQAELPYFIHFPFMLLFPFSLYIVRLPYALFSIGTVILLMLISNKIFNKKIAVAVGIIGAINPWNVVMGRTSYEAILSTLLYLSLCYLLVTYKRKYIPLIIVTMFLAFYSYIGTKIILFPLVLISLGYFMVKNKKKIRSDHGLLLLVPILITIFFLVSIRSQQSRMSDLFFPNSVNISSQVNDLRKGTLASPLTNVFINKFTVYTQVLLDRFFRIISPSYLFLNGDLFFPLQNYGFFYAIDFIFILFGMLNMYKRNRLELLLIVFLLFIGTSPHIFFRLSGDFSHHLALMFPWMLLLVGYGVVTAISFFPQKKQKYVIVSLFFLYAFFFLQFIQKNFYSQPWQNNGDFDSRILSHYLNIGDKNRQYIVYSNSGKDLFAKYIFYTNSMDIHSIRDIQNTWKTKSLHLNNISFENCPYSEIEYKEDMTYIISNSCYKPKTFNNKLTIPIIKDGGERYAIINDSLCRQVILKRYPADLTFNSFAVEKLDKRQFCQSFITVL